MQVNQPSNLIDRIIKLERELAAVRKKVGLSSAIISRGGLTLVDDSYITMTDSDGVQILYIGPSPAGDQIIRIRREGGAPVLYTYKAPNFDGQFWALTDATGRIIMSDSAEVGAGLARPWIPVALYPKFTTHTYTTDPGLGETFDYMDIDTARLSGETVLWEGRASVSHPWVTIEGVWGRSVATPNVTYRLKFANTEVGSWNVNSGPTAGRQGRFSVKDFVGQDWVEVTVTASASGAGAIACQVLSCYLQ